MLQQTRSVLPQTLAAGLRRLGRVVSVPFGGVDARLRTAVL